MNYRTYTRTNVKTHVYDVTLRHLALHCIHHIHTCTQTSQAIPNIHTYIACHCRHTRTHFFWYITSNYIKYNHMICMYIHTHIKYIITDSHTYLHTSHTSIHTHIHFITACHIHTYNTLCAHTHTHIPDISLTRIHTSIHTYTHVTLQIWHTYIRCIAFQYIAVHKICTHTSQSITTHYITPYNISPHHITSHAQILQYIHYKLTYIQIH